MQKTLLLLFLATAACNGTSSSTDHQTGTGGSLPIGTPPPGTGGSQTVNGGASGAPLGGTVGSASGGGVGQASSRTGGSTLPVSTTPGTGGAATTGTGGTTVAGLGGMQGMGGSTTGSAGAKGMDAAPDVGTSDVGTLQPGTGGASGTGGSRGTGGATGAGGATTACVPAASPGQSGMNSGQACLTCHSSGGRMSRMPFSAAGTLYASATGGGTVSGATVTIIGSDNKKVTVVTGSDGNFYTDSPIAFPATAQISKCPDTATMSVALSAGDCNSCHGSSMRLHLP